MMSLMQIENAYKGRFVNLPNSFDEIRHDMGDASFYKPIIKFIRAAWCRCCIVSIYGHCYIWGTTFKGENIKEPRLVLVVAPHVPAWSPVVISSIRRLGE